jgi:hypothetical protein
MKILTNAFANGEAITSPSAIGNPSLMPPLFPSRMRVSRWSGAFR